MEIWSATLREDGRPHTFLGRVFAALEGRQRDYDFLLAGVEACPTLPEHAFVNHGPVWLSGEELTAMVRREDFQWIWCALLAFSPEMGRERAEATLRALYAPEAPDVDSGRIRAQFGRTGAEFMIYGEDSTLTELLAVDPAWVCLFCSHEPDARAAKREAAPEET